MILHLKEEEKMVVAIDKEFEYSHSQIKKRKRKKKKKKLDTNWKVLWCICVCMYMFSVYLGTREATEVWLLNKAGALSRIYLMKNDMPFTPWLMQLPSTKYKYHVVFVTETTGTFRLNMTSRFLKISDIQPFCRLLDVKHSRP